MGGGLQLGLLILVALVTLSLGAGFGGDEDVADVHGLVLLAATAVEQAHIVAGTHFQDLRVAVLTGVIEEPVTHNAVRISGVSSVVIGGLFVIAGNGLSAVVCGQDLFCGGLGSLLGGSLLLVGGLNGVAVGIRGGIGSAADDHILPGSLVVGLGICLISGFQFLIGVGQAVRIALGISLILQHPQDLLVVDLLRHDGAQISLEICLYGHAGGFRGGLQGVQGVLVLLLHAGGELIPIFLGLLQTPLDHGHLLDCVVHDIIMPGGAFLHAQHGSGGGVHRLALQGGVGVQAQIADEIGVALQEAAVDILIIEIHLGGTVLFTVNGQGRGVAGDNVGSPEEAGNYHQHEQYGDDAVQNVAALFSLLFFQILFCLGIYIAGGRLILPELFFS